jgi:hypothetical protein
MSQDASMGDEGVDSEPDAVAVVPAVSGLFAAPVARTVVEATLITTKGGNIVSTSRREFVQEVSDRSFEEFRSHIIEDMQFHDDYRGIKYQRWVFIRFAGVSNAEMEARYVELGRHGCDVIGITQVRGECCVIAHRVHVKKPLDLINVDGLQGFYTLKVKCTRDLSSFAVTVLQSWLKVGSAYVLNFRVDEQVTIDSRMLARQWDALSIDECNWEIIEANEKTRLKKPCSSRDVLISKMGRDLLKRKRDAMQGASSYRCAAESSLHIHLGDFAHLDNVICETMDVISGHMMSFPLMQWLSRGYHKQYSLVLHGDSDLGKTQLALSLLSDLSMDLQKQDEFPSYFIKVGTVRSRG